MKTARKRKHAILVIATALLILCACFGIRYLVRVNRYQEDMKCIDYSITDFSLLGDGVYFGEHDVDFIYAQVEVVVKDGIVTDIQLLEHFHDRGEAAAVI